MTSAEWKALMTSSTSICRLADHSKRFFPSICINYINVLFYEYEKLLKFFKIFLCVANCRLTLSRPISEKIDVDDVAVLNCGKI